MPGACGVSARGWLSGPLFGRTGRDPPCPASRRQRQIEDNPQRPHTARGGLRSSAARDAGCRRAPARRAYLPAWDDGVAGVCASPVSLIGKIEGKCGTCLSACVICDDDIYRLKHTRGLAKPGHELCRGNSGVPVVSASALLGVLATCKALTPNKGSTHG